MDAAPSRAGSRACQWPVGSLRSEPCWPGTRRARADFVVVRSGPTWAVLDERTSSPSGAEGTGCAGSPPSAGVLACGVAEPPPNVGLSRGAFIGHTLQVGADVSGGVSNCPADATARHGSDGCHSSQSPYAYVEHVSDFLGSIRTPQFVARLDRTHDVTSLSRERSMHPGIWSGSHRRRIALPGSPAWTWCVGPAAAISIHSRGRRPSFVSSRPQRAPLAGRGSLDVAAHRPGADLHELVGGWRNQRPQVRPLRLSARTSMCRCRPSVR